MPKNFTRVALVLALVLGTGGCATTPTSREPRNLSLLKEEIATYIDSGHYDADLTAVAAEARVWIEQRTSQKQPGERLALVLDIDETALSNLPAMRRIGFGYDPKMWDAWINEAGCPPIVPVRETYRTALSRGSAIFFITGRWEKDRAVTEKNLRAAGYDGFTALYCAADESQETAEAFKTALRKKLTEQGYAIIANIGDQMSDLNGGYAERTFKLADPFYLTK